MTEKKMSTAERLEDCRKVLLVHSFNQGEENLIRIPLYGKHGVGRYMVLDISVWRDGRDNRDWPADWTAFHEPKSGRYYPVTCRQPFARKNKGIYLARLVMKARKNEVVTYRDGDTLNLRRSNLEKISRAEFFQRRLRRGLKQTIFVEVECSASAPA